MNFVEALSFVLAVSKQVYSTINPSTEARRKRMLSGSLALMCDHQVVLFLNLSTVPVLGASQKK